MNSTTATHDDRCGRRTGADRRVREEPIVHTERRKGDRRSGDDRRSETR